MRMHHSPTHWILVALVLAALLLTLGEAHGQGAAAAFEGRPAMAGAQAGLGAQAGPPQGGIGVQGAEAAQRSLPLRRPATTQDMPQGQPAAGTPVAATAALDTATARREVRQPKDTSVAREERSAVTTGKRAAKRTLRRSRTGVGEIDSRARTGS